MAYTSSSSSVRLPMLPTPRPVDPHWRCQRSGDCCTKPAEVVMTREERVAMLLIAPQTIPSEWRDVNETMVALKAAPCPFFIFHECQVYEARPYSCRRFACLRPDPKIEPFEIGGPLGCKNLSDRIATSRTALRFARKIQRKGQRWARRHGWPSDPSGDGGA